MVVAGLDLHVITASGGSVSDRPELEAHRNDGEPPACVGGKWDMRPAELAELLARLEPRLMRLAVKLGPGPWAVSIQQDLLGEVVGVLVTDHRRLLRTDMG